jgi:hypothetical protein
LYATTLLMSRYDGQEQRRKAAWTSAPVCAPPLVATALVLVSELLNSAGEGSCDFIETRHHEKIEIIKDIAAAPVASPSSSGWWCWTTRSGAWGSGAGQR